MTDEQINAAIAKACGWTDVTASHRSGRAPRADYVGCEFYPNYCADLNAMHEAEKVYMNTPEKIQILVQILEWWLDAVVQKRSKGTPIWHATPRQRAEAFLRTLGKWEEVQE